MKLKKIKSGTSIKFIIEGRIDATNAADIGMAINDELDNMRELILDFLDVEYISSMGLRVVLELQKRMKEQGRMKVVNVNDTVMDIFKMTGFDKFMTIEQC